MVCLDSSFVIDYLRGVPSAKEVLDKLQGTNENLVIPSPVVMELISGAYLSKKVLFELDKIKSFLSSFIILDFDKESAFNAGKIEAELITSGKIIDVEDIMIASIVVSNGERLLTKNPKHFERVGDLKIVNYPQG